MPNYDLMNLVPKFSAPIFVYFNIVGGYLGMGSTALAAGIDAGVGDVFGELLYNFMTNSKTTIWGLIKCGASHLIGAFLAIRFILPMTGLDSSNRLILTVAAVVGGNLMKWFSGIFLNK